MLVGAHTESKTRSSDHDKLRVAQFVARNAFGVSRLMPILHRGRVFAWCGWSWLEHCSYVFHHKPWMQTQIDRNGLLCGFNSVDGMIRQITVNGQMRQAFWFKGISTGTLLQDWTHHFGVNEYPAAGDFAGTAATARQRNDQTLGALMHGGNVSPMTKHVISAWVRTDDVAASARLMVLYDMVLTYDQTVTSATPTTFTNTLPAQRYISAGDPGLQIMGMYNTVSGGGTSYTSFKYTSIGGTAGQTIPGTTMTTVNNATAPGNGNPGLSCFSYITTGPGASLLMVPLQNGDSGVKQLDSITMSATPAESNNYILGFPLAWIPIYNGLEDTYSHDYVKQISALPRVRDGACLTFALLNPIAATGPTSSAGVNVAWG
jgi:hypothetical protein